MTLRKWFTPQVVNKKSPVVQALLRYPVLRGGLYLIGSLATVRGIVHIYDVTIYRGRETEGDLVSRLTVVPCISFLTWTFVKLRQEDLRRWNRIPTIKGVTHFAQGLGLGTCGFLLTVGLAYAFGWVRLPVTRGEGLIGRNVLDTLTIYGAQYAAVAWYEEMIYRGYGLDAALASGRSSIAIPALASVFALAHGPSWQGFASHGAMALTATALRLGSNSLWLPVGYHFAWNYVQTAILGPSDGRPSLIPLEVNGPTLWIGRPGHAEPPGLLVAIAHAVIGIAYILVRWIRSES